MQPRRPLPRDEIPLLKATLPDFETALQEVLAAEARFHPRRGKAPVSELMSADLAFELRLLARRLWEVPLPWYQRTYRNTHPVRIMWQFVGRAQNPYRADGGVDGARRRNTSKRIRRTIEAIRRYIDDEWI